MGPGEEAGPRQYHPRLRFADQARRLSGNGVGAVAIVVVVLLVAHARAVLGGGMWFLKDALEYFYPVKLLVRRRLLAGDLPHWAGDAGLGVPVLADPGFAALYPMNLALLLPEPSGVTLFLWLHLLIGALGTAALTRRAESSRTAAAFGGLCFALGGYATSMLAPGTYLLGMVWTPAILAAVDALVDRPRASTCAVLAALWGSQIASGEMQSVLVTGYLAGAWVLARQPGSGFASRMRAMGWLAMGAVASTALSAAQLLPYLTLFSHSRRQSGLSLDAAQQLSMHPVRLAEVLFPALFGDANRSGSFFAYSLDRDGFPFDRWPWMVTPYVGGATLLLAVAAWGGPGPRRRFTQFWTSAAIVSMLLAFGRHTPLFAVWFRVVPLVSVFRYPAKYFAVAALAIPCLAAAGLDALLAGLARARRLLFLAVFATIIGAGAIAVTAGAIASRTLALPSSIVDLAAGAVRETTFEGLLVPALVAALVVFGERRNRRVSVAAIQVVGVADLWFHVVAPVPVLDGSISRARPAWLNGEHPRIWMEAGDVNLTGVTSPLPRTEQATRAVAATVPNLALLFGAAPAKLYTATKLRDELAFWGATKEHRRAVLDAYGVEFIVRDRRVTGTEGLEPVAQLPESGVDVLRNLRALPRVYFAGVGLPVGSPEEAVARLADPRVAGGEAVLLESSVGDGAEAGAEPRGTVPDLDACHEVASDDHNGVRVSCRAPRPGWVVLSYADWWGWGTEVDGTPAPVERANGRGMASRIPAGAHQIVLRYREPAYPLGLATTLLAAVALSLGIGIERLRAKTPSRADLA